MRYSKLAILIISFQVKAMILFSQNLTVEETVKYLNDQIGKYKIEDFFISDDRSVRYYSSFNNLSITITPSGFVNMEVQTKIKGRKKMSTISSIFDYRSVIPEIKSNNTLSLKCKSTSILSNDCIEVKGLTFTTSELDISKLSLEGIQKVKNAFEYLFDIIEYDPRYNRTDDDPFSKSNYRKNIRIDTSVDRNIKLEYDGGVSTVTVEIGGVLVTMILDSGASDVSISSELEKLLREKGIITDDNYLEPGLYKIANGNIVSSKRLKIPIFKVGAFEVKDIICSVNASNDVLLLGKSFLNLFSKWSIDNNKHILILEK